MQDLINFIVLSINFGEIIIYLHHLSMDINLWRDYLNLPTKEKRKKLARKKVHADNIAKSQYRELVVRSSVMSQLSTTLRDTFCDEVNGLK